jgi:hypothetical protein
MEHLHHATLSTGVEIDAQIAAADQVDSGEKGIARYILAREYTHVTNTFRNGSCSRTFR